MPFSNASIVFITIIRLFITKALIFGKFATISTKAGLKALHFNLIRYIIAKSR